MANGQRRFKEIDRAERRSVDLEQGAVGELEARESFELRPANGLPYDRKS